jgi:hypothetical protein
MTPPPQKKRHKQGPEDTVETAFRVFQEFLAEADPEPPKNPKSVEAGRKGGAKGGVARAAKLSDEERSEIAKKAAKARWGKPD